MTERSWVQKLNPHHGDHLSGTIHLDQSLEQKLWKTLTWHCCMCCNPANGRVDFEQWSAYQIQLNSTEWIVSLSDGDWDQSPKIEFRKLMTRIWNKKETRKLNFRLITFFLLFKAFSFSVSWIGKWSRGRNLSNQNFRLG